MRRIIDHLGPAFPQGIFVVHNGQDTSGSRRSAGRTSRDTDHGDDRHRDWGRLDRLRQKIHIVRRLCQVRGMAQEVSVIVGDDDRARRGDRQGSQPAAQARAAGADRAAVGGPAAGGGGGQAGEREPAAVWRWQRRFGARRERPAARQDPAAGNATVAGRNGCTGGGNDLRRPPGEATHWTGRAMAKQAGISLRTVQRIWAEHDLQPHRLRTFKRSNDPAFAEKLRDIVGLYVDPPAHSLVLSLDEKSQIQALDRTQPGLPLKPGKAGTWTHDYKRHGTTTLFAALNVLDGRVIGRCMTRHRHQEFIRFLNAIEREVPTGKVIHVIELCCPQAPQGPCLAGPPPALDLPLHADLRLLAQRGRGDAHPAAAEARRVPLHRRAAGRHQPLPRRAQPGAPTLHLDSLCRCHPRPHRHNPCTFCVNQRI